MTKSLAALTASATIILVVASMATAQNGGGWRPLFDGKTTNGWRGYRQQAMPEGWTVVDGTLTRSGKGGDIVTVDQFGDFELALEWKIAPGGNSGIFYRVTEDDPVMWHSAPEYQVLDDAGHKGPLKPTQKCGSNYDLHPPSRDAAKPAGSWNDTRIIVQGNHVEHWLNGAKVIEYELGSAALKAAKAKSKFKDVAGWGEKIKGHILLQDHGDEVWYQNIRIRELPATPTSRR